MRTSKTKSPKSLFCLKVAWLQLSSIAYVQTTQLESLCRISADTTYILITSDLVLAVAQLTFSLDSFEELQLAVYPYFSLLYNHTEMLGDFS